MAQSRRQNGNADAVEPWFNTLSTPGKVERRLTVINASQCTADWGYRGRVLPEHLIYLIEQNVMAGRIGDTTLRLEPGDLLWVARGVRHSFWNEDPDHPISVLHLRFAMPDRALPLPDRPPFTTLRNAWPAHATFQQLIDDSATHLPHRARRLAAGLTLLLTSILRLANQQTAAQRTLTPAQREMIYAMLRADPSARFAASDLADAVRLSPDYFTRLFRATFGKPPRRWLLEQRIRHAASLLDDTTLDVTEIAHELGYHEVFLFSRQFRDVMGVSPTRYRRRSFTDAAANL